MTLGGCLVVSAVLFALGLFGALTRRNAIGILMSIELIFNAANLNLVTDRSRAKVQQDLAAKMTELERRLREVQQVKVASKN